jgi:hypothetical protein
MNSAPGDGQDGGVKAFVSFDRSAALVPLASDKERRVSARLRGFPNRGSRRHGPNHTSVAEVNVLALKSEALTAVALGRRHVLDGTSAGRHAPDRSAGGPEYVSVGDGNGRRLRSHPTEEARHREGLERILLVSADAVSRSILLR